MDEDSDNMGMQDIKFDPQQLAELTNQAENVVTKLTAASALGQSLVDEVMDAGQVVGMEGVQVVEMDGARLGQIIQMDEELGSGMGIQMESGQVIHLDQSQILEMERGGPVVVTSGDFVSHHIEGMPELKVHKRRGSNGEIVVEVEGQDGQMMDIGQSLTHSHQIVTGEDCLEIDASQEVLEDAIQQQEDIQGEIIQS